MLTFMKDLKCCVNAFLRERNRQMIEFDLTSAQVDVLIHLLRRPPDEPVYATTLQEYFSLSCPTVNGILERLHRKKLIRFQTDRRDRRKRKILPTAKCRELDKILLPFGPEYESELITVLTPEEKAMLPGIAAKLAEQARQLEMEKRK